MRTVDADAIGDLPGGVDGSRHQWVDLDAEGIPGVITDGDGALYYRRNLGDGELGPAAALGLQPSSAAPAAAAAAHGSRRRRPPRSRRVRPAAARFLRARARRAAARATGNSSGRSRRIPQIAWTDADLRFIDLDGDGLDDLLIAKDDTFVWYPSLGNDGFGPPRILPRPRDEERGPAIVFADSRHSIALADLSGDGLRDFVRVENGCICYWPNLGQGRFGAKVTMAAAPIFDRPDQFEARRVLFADVDGTGTSDVLYAGRDGVRYWLNQAGNAWSRAARRRRAAGRSLRGERHCRRCARQRHRLPGVVVGSARRHGDPLRRSDGQRETAPARRSRQPARR